MLSRLSSLFIYVVAGLVISAAATPMMGPTTSDYNEEPKSRPMVPSYPKSSPHPKPYYQMEKAYARGDDKPYPRPHPDEKKYPEQKKYSEKPSRPDDKKSSDDKGKEHKPDNYKDRMSSDDVDRKDYGKGRKDYDKGKDGKSDRDHDKDRKDYDKGKDSKSYHDEDHNPSNTYCNVGEQHCCDTVNDVKEVQKLGLLGLASGISLTDLTGVFGTNCSPMFWAEGGGKCNAQPICCDNNNIEGLVAIGCSNVNVF
ncbi:hypothetical protein V8E53_004308 [Lactarius tabidus]